MTRIRRWHRESRTPTISAPISSFHANTASTIATTATATNTVAAITAVAVAVTTTIIIAPSRGWPRRCCFERCLCRCKSSLQCS